MRSQRQHLDIACDNPGESCIQWRVVRDTLCCKALKARDEWVRWHPTILYLRTLVRNCRANRIGARTHLCPLLMVETACGWWPPLAVQACQDDEVTSGLKFVLKKSWLYVIQRGYQQPGQLEASPCRTDVWRLVCDESRANSTKRRHTVFRNAIVPSGQYQPI